MKHDNKIRFLCQIKVSINNIIVFIGVKYSVRDLVCDINKCVWPATQRYASLR